jgi:hypothetical protein
MKWRRGIWWYVAAALYIAVVVAEIPLIERYFSPFNFHVFGPQ